MRSTHAGKSEELEEQEARTKCREKDEGTAPAEPEKGGFLFFSVLHSLLFPSLEQPFLVLLNISIVLTTPELPYFPMQNPGSLLFPISTYPSS